MAEYKDIHGTNIEVVSSDPSNPILGQVWYNTTSQVLKGFSSNPAGSWATSTAMNTGKQTTTGSGTKDAAIVFGGQISTGYTTTTEVWDGSSWTEVNDLNTARDGMFVSSAGPSTATLGWGGRESDPTVSSKVESWDGTDWTETTDINTARAFGSGSGTQTAALAFGGASIPLPGSSKDETETWNGSSWTEVGDLNTARFYIAGAGASNTAALGWGGYDGSSYVNSCESWNGSAWTEVNNINNAGGQSGEAGTSSSMIKMGGGPGARAYTEEWNGTSWTEVNDLNTARSGGGSAGSSTAARYSGGYTATAITDVSEAWTAPTQTTVTFTVS